MTDRDATPPLILVVDDDQSLLAVVTEVLSSRGYRVETAENGEQALALIANEQPDVVLLDMSMPVMDGWSFAKLLRERYGRRIPIIVITAAQDSQLRADEIGANADLGKPFETQELFDAVEDALVDASP